MLAFANRATKPLITGSLRGSLCALSIGLATVAPETVAAQDASSSSGRSSPTKLPEIHVIATTPVAPPPRRAPARVSAGAAPARRTAAPAAPAPAPAEATTTTSVPGAVEQDKIPSNVQ